LVELVKHALNSNVSAFLIHMYISSFQELGSGEKSRATVEEER
jgi:hypothetical protein